MSQFASFSYGRFSSAHVWSTLNNNKNRVWNWLKIPKNSNYRQWTLKNWRNWERRSVSAARACQEERRRLCTQSKTYINFPIQIVYECVCACMYNVHNVTEKKNAFYLLWFEFRLENRCKCKVNLEITKFPCISFQFRRWRQEITIIFEEIRRQHNTRHRGSQYDQERWHRDSF